MKAVEAEVTDAGPPTPRRGKESQGPGDGSLLQDVWIPLRSGVTSLKIRSSILAICLCLTAGMARAQVVKGNQLIPNPGLSDGAKGWEIAGLVVSDAKGHGESEALVLAARKSPLEKLKFLRVRIPSPPVERSLTLRFYTKTSKGAGNVLCSAVARRGHPPTRLGHRREIVPTSMEDWIEKRIELVLPKTSDGLVLALGSVGRVDVLLSDVTLTVGEAGAEVNLTPSGRVASEVLTGPGVLRATAGATVRASEEGDTGLVLFPIPNLYRNQVPLTFSLKAKPESALLSFRWIPREDGRNLLCEAKVKVERGKDVDLSWEALVLAIAGPEEPLPVVKEVEQPDHAKAWLVSTRCAQSADKDIIVKADELAKGTTDILDYVRNVLAFTSKNQGIGTTYRFLDARSALESGGSCTSRANLCAALLRAHGIPARTLSHLPTWSGPLFEHWLVEY